MLNSLRRKPALFGASLGSVALVAPVSAHHGSGISYDMEHLWKTKATVVEFKYANPHPWLVFDRTNDKGETELSGSQKCSRASRAVFACRCSVVAQTSSEMPAKINFLQPQCISPKRAMAAYS